MMKTMNVRPPLLLALVVFNLSVLSAHGQTPQDPMIPSKCQTEQDVKLGFSPRAITRTAVNVRAQIPDYSFLKGQWVLGRWVDTLTPNTCVAITDRQMVGVVQIWYLVQYKSENTVKSGWVWGGTKGVDDTRYIGGDTNPQGPGQEGSSLEILFGRSSRPFAATLAYAQVDFPPGEGAGPARTKPDAAPSETAAVYYVRIPVLGWVVKATLFSLMALFLAMVGGMVAKVIWDQTESSRLIPRLAALMRPLLVSPITFAGFFYSPLYAQTGAPTLSLATALYAFQVGFMWQHVLERKLANKPG